MSSTELAGYLLNDRDALHDVRRLAYREKDVGIVYSETADNEK